MNLPTTLTIGRIVLVPLVIWLILTHEFKWAFVAFVVAGMTDALDGFLARLLDQRTELGAYLDAVADKMLLVSIYITLGLTGKMPASLILIVVFRDALIIGAVILSWLMEHPVDIRPLYISKVNTTAQIILAAVILAVLSFELETGFLIPALMLSVAALTLASASAYLKEWMIHMSAAPPNNRHNQK